MEKIKGEHIAFAVMVIVGILCFLGPLIVILEPSKQSRTVESIERQMKFLESQIAELRAKKGIDLLTDAEIQAMVERGESREKIEKVNRTVEAGNEKSKELKQKLISEYEARIEELRNELNETF
jgi:predicted RNase H-like nuclease (RuvC/YqgF family)